MSYILQYSVYNSYSILVEWPAVIDEKILRDVLNFKNKIEKHYIKQKVEVINTYVSILIIYDSTIDNVNDAFLELKQLYLQEINIPHREASIWNIPVCYDEEFGIDLSAYCIEKKLSKSKVISLHTAPIYTVYFIGFLPGFLYLGGLDSRLVLDRKKTPKLHVKKGSVAIGGQQTGIYPQDSPGGWYSIGNSPIELFNPNRNPPCKIQAGDKVKFNPISPEEHTAILLSVENSTYQLQTLNHHA
jgi:inhibitor of KinA